MRYIIPSMVIIFSLSFFPLAFADRGMISISPNVSVYEPGQKAIIAWNEGLEVPEESLREINPNIASLFPGGTWLQALKYTGELKALTVDLKIQRLFHSTGVFKGGKCTTGWGKIKADLLQ